MSLQHSKIFCPNSISANQGHELQHDCTVWKTVPSLWGADREVFLSCTDYHSPHTMKDPQLKVRGGKIKRDVRGKFSKSGKFVELAAAQCGGVWIVEWFQEGDRYISDIKRDERYEEEVGMSIWDQGEISLDLIESQSRLEGLKFTYFCPYKYKLS